eukprot:CAMPEP_0172758234 /NCGR_PEP_ID=MMETSP1074-20121228/165339_1 /TAXON_ID=2916 /ORGANISM="Ceratium fusus, Strain PA161109" /LENGTH=113 /DNA_ID=CAMNT_0013591785 /DNA_START=199 /DNA_END=540 /DNA_ORIENTATION=+
MRQTTARGLMAHHIKTRLSNPFATRVSMIALAPRSNAHPNTMRMSLQPVPSIMATFSKRHIFGSALRYITFCIESTGMSLRRPRAALAFEISFAAFTLHVTPSRRIAVNEKQT